MFKRCNQTVPLTRSWFPIIALLMVMSQRISSAMHVRASQPRQTRILIYPFGHCLNSHLLNAERLAKILAVAGHGVDVLISSHYDQMDNKHCSNDDDEFPEDEKHEEERRPRLVTFDPPVSFTPVCDYDTVDFMLYATLSERFGAFYGTSLSYCDALLSNAPLLNSLKATGYDLAIVESIDPCSRILVDFLDVPFILLVTTGLGHFDSNPRPPSYLPAPIAPFTSQMNLGQRIVNTVIKLMYDRAIPAYIGSLTAFEELKQKHNLNRSLSLTNSFDGASIK